MKSIYIDESGNISGYLPQEKFEGRYYRAKEVDALVEAVRILTDIWEDNDSEIPLVINEIMEDIIKNLKPFLEVK